MGGGGGGEGGELMDRGWLAGWVDGVVGQRRRCGDIGEGREARVGMVSKKREMSDPAEQKC